jgi:hypothetical protein
MLTQTTSLARFRKGRLSCRQERFAVLTQVEGEVGGLIFFIDDDKACTPMPVPKELINMLRDIGVGTIAHDGAAT